MISTTTYPPYPARYTSRTWTSMPPSHGFFAIGGSRFFWVGGEDSCDSQPGWREEWCGHFKTISCHFMIHVSVFHIYLMDPRVFSFHLSLAKFIGWLWVFLSVSIEAWLVHPIQAFKRYQWRWVEKHPRLSSQKKHQISHRFRSYTIPP